MPKTERHIREVVLTSREGIQTGKGKWRLNIRIRFLTGSSTRVWNSLSRERGKLPCLSH